MRSLRRCINLHSIAIATNAISIDAESVADASDCESGLVCEHCGNNSLTLMDEIDKPSWTDVLRISSEACPNCYRESLDLDDRRFCDDAMGEGFSHLVRLVPDK